MKKLIVLIVLALAFSVQAQDIEIRDNYHRFYMADSISGRVDSTLVFEVDVGRLGITGFGAVRVMIDTGGNAGHPNNTPNIDLLVIRKARGRTATAGSLFSSIGAGAWGTNAFVYRPTFNSKGVARFGQINSIEDTLVFIDSLSSVFYNAVADCTFEIPFGTEILRFELNEDSTTAAGDTSRGIWAQLEAIFQ